jgi:hypothetical protein
VAAFSALAILARGCWNAGDEKALFEATGPKTAREEAQGIFIAVMEAMIATPIESGNGVESCCYA